MEVLGHCLTYFLSPCLCALGSLDVPSRAIVHCTSNHFDPTPKKPTATLEAPSSEKGGGGYSLEKVLRIWVAFALGAVCCWLLEASDVCSRTHDALSSAGSSSLLGMSRCWSCIYLLSCDIPQGISLAYDTLCRPFFCVCREPSLPGCRWL